MVEVGVLVVAVPAVPWVVCRCYRPLQPPCLCLAPPLLQEARQGVARHPTVLRLRLNWGHLPHLLSALTWPIHGTPATRALAQGLLSRSTSMLISSLQVSVLAKLCSDLANTRHTSHSSFGSGPALKEH